MHSIRFDLRRVFQVLAAIVFLAMLAESARADEAPFLPFLGAAGHGALSVENLFGYTHTSLTTHSSGSGDRTQSDDTVSLFGNLATSTYAVPRLAGDLFVARSFSLGVGLMYMHLSTSGRSADAFQVAPRVGYAVAAGSRLVIWPRVGITYDYTSQHQSGNDIPSSVLGLTIEVPFAIRTSARTAVLLIPAAQIGLGGSVTSVTPFGSDKVDQKATEFGLQVGFLMTL